MALSASFGDLTIDSSARELRRSGEPVDIEPRAFDLLVYLFEHRDRAVSKDELQDEVWGTIVSESALTRSVMKLRRSLGDSDESIIKTVPRFGYRFVADVDDETPPQTASSDPVRSAKGWAIGGVLALALAVVVLWQMTHVEPIEDKSVAVLPFADLSAAQDHQWFADGLAEEVLNALARTPDLRVAGKFSSFGYRDVSQDLASIAESLGVAHVLHGSVRHDGERIRVTLQLIRAADGSHLWSDNYDFGSESLIEAQESVATDVATALQTTMDPERLAEFVSSGTRSVEAFELYLRGLSAHAGMVASGNVDGFTDSITYFEQAVDIDPEFAYAWKAIADYWATQLNPSGIASQVNDVPREQMVQKYDQAITTAIAHAPDPVSTLSMRADKAMREMNLRQALRYNEEYLSHRPFDPWAKDAYVGLLTDLNRHDEATEAAFRFMETPGSHTVLAARSLLSVMYAGDAQRTEAFAALVAAEYSNSVIAMYQLHRSYLWSGNIAKAREVYQTLVASEMPADNRFLSQLRQLCAEGKAEEAQTLFEARAQYTEGRHTSEWLAHMTMGYHEEAVAMLKPLDAEADLTQFQGYLLYTMFDPAEYPNLSEFLETYGNEPGLVTRVPFRCFD